MPRKTVVPDELPEEHGEEETPVSDYEGLEVNFDASEQTDVG